MRIEEVDKIKNKIYSGFDEAVADKTVVPLLYEGRHVDQKVNREAIDTYFDRVCESLREYQTTDLKKKLLGKGEATELFGSERGQALGAILGAVHQSFGGEDVYPSVEEKAAGMSSERRKSIPYLKNMTSIPMLFPMI